MKRWLEITNDPGSAAIAVILTYLLMDWLYGLIVARGGMPWPVVIVYTILGGLAIWLVRRRSDLHT